MSRKKKLIILVVGIFIACTLTLIIVGAFGPKTCCLSSWRFIPCVIGNYESLSGGLIAAAAALIAGWSAWSAVQLQIEAEDRRAAADRQEIEELLSKDVDELAEGYAALWKVLDSLTMNDDANRDQQNRTIDTNTDQQILVVQQFIEFVIKESWLRKSRQMVSNLGWDRRRKYEELFDGLEEIRQYRKLKYEDIHEARSAFARVSSYFEVLQPETEAHFNEFFRRGGKAWSISYAILHAAGLEE